MVARALALSLRQLGERRIFVILAQSLLIALIVTAVLAGLAGKGVDMLAARYLDAYGVSELAAGLVAILVFIFAFRAVAIPVLSLFGDAVVAAVEMEHYPQAAAKARPAGLGLSAKLGLMSLIRFLLVNVAALPLYIVLIFTAIGPLILFVALNAILLGRDLGEMVAVRHLDPAATKQWLRATRGRRALLGLAVTGAFMIPFANLIAPMLGAAAATHLFHGNRT